MSDDIRSKLRDDASEDYELLKAALKEGLNADKAVTRKCEHCYRSNTFLLADHSARMKAVDLWISQGFGKPPTEEREQELNLVDIDVASMSIEARTALRRRILRKFPDLAQKMTGDAEAAQAEELAAASVYISPRSKRGRRGGS